MSRARNERIGAVWLLFATIRFGTTVCVVLDTV